MDNQVWSIRTEKINNVQVLCPAYPFLPLQQIQDLPLFYKEAVDHTEQYQELGATHGETWMLHRTNRRS